MATVVFLPQKYTNENQFISVLKLLNEQRIEHRFCDVILRVGKEQIYAHSNVLSAASPYFGAFLGRGQDNPRTFSQKSPQIIEFHIDGSGDNTGYSDAVSVIVDFIYTGALTLNSKVLVQVIEIAKIMEMEKVLDFCNKFQAGKGNDVKEFNATEMQTEPYSFFSNDAGIQTDYSQSEEHVVTPDKAQTASQSHVKIFTKDYVYNTISKKRKLAEMKNQSDSQSIVSSFEKVKRLIKKVEIPARPAKTSESLDTTTEDKSATEDSVKIESLCSLGDGNEKVKQEKVDIKEENTFGKRLAPRKTRGKRPSKFLDDVESDNDALIVDEHVEKEENAQHEKSGLLTCDECPYSSFSSYHFGRHQQAHRNEQEKLKNYICDKCDFTTTSRKVYQSHAIEHLHAENICSFCDFEAENKESLIQHLYTHKPPFPYLCMYCSATFRSRPQLNSHLPKHLNIKPYVCEICNAGFKWKHALKSHMATHSETKDHLCDVCGFSTAHKSQLKAHRLIHTGDTFKCEHPNCKFQTIKRQSLKYHMLTHTQEKPHQCEICGQSFSLRKNMKRHSLLHTDTRPYKCKFGEGCNFAATRYDKLKEHMLKIHDQGEVPGKKFRLSDYPKSLVPPDTSTNPETSAAVGTIQNIIRIENSELNMGQTSGSGETKVYIQQPGGETLPVTLVASKFDIPYQFIARLEN